MKIRFIPKQQREEIKNKKQADQPAPAPTQQPQNHQMKDEMTERDRLDRKRSHQQEQEEVERSREKRVLPRVELNKLEKSQMKEMKDKHLGLVKPPKVNRYDDNYKTKLLFEWEKSEDTSGGVLNQFGTESLRKMEERQSNRAELQLGKNWKDKAYSEMTDRDWRIFREDMEIFIKGGRVAYPFREWDECRQLNPDLLRNLRRLDFKKPKPIQMQSIPIGFECKDMVAIAPTGEGKTLGFLIPALHHVENLERLNAANSDKGPYVIVLVPSRELAEQIEDQFMKIRYGGITAVRVVGGLQMDFQVMEMEKGCDILIGTPGRIKEMVEKHYLALMRCSWVVIDEADKMISENLSEDVEWILESFGSDSVFTREEHGKSRVTHMFSATMVPEIEKLTKKYMVAPVCVTIGEEGVGKKQIHQQVEFVNENQKNDALARILRGLPGPIIIFVNERSKCEKLCKIIEMRCGRTCCDYHGGKTQDARQSIIQNFRQGKFEILVTTDLGGRGLDIKGISAAISYDAPKNISEFVHRAGRSGRAGVKGKAFTLLTNEDEGIFFDVKNFLEKNNFKVPPQLKDHPAAQMKPGSFAQLSRRKQVVYTN